MTTTTIRLPLDLKARVATAAERAGTSAHSYILEAIAQKAELDEARRDFEATAERRFVEIVKTGKSIPWKDMRRYLEARASGVKAVKPAARRIGR